MQALSRAFRSRFLELHVGDIPDAELANILQERCALAPSYAVKLVAVMRELQRRRQVSCSFCTPLLSGSNTTQLARNMPLAYHALVLHHECSYFDSRILYAWDSMMGCASKGGSVCRPQMCLRASMGTSRRATCSSGLGGELWATSSWPRAATCSWRSACDQRLSAPWYRGSLKASCA